MVIDVMELVIFLSESVGDSFKDRDIKVVEEGQSDEFG